MSEYPLTDAIIDRLVAYFHEMNRESGRRIEELVIQRPQDDGAAIVIRYEPVGPIDVDKPRSIKCPRCGLVSFSPKDIEHRYCGYCHRFHEEL